ncbi:MAG: metalloregulator ArsR/SmtB family transcription factor [Alphaproteobacteria bacterium]|jgi:DNA-binding transcriptional ArsR family regulator|nr:metalloregulator ArsR/SmtB family transcription factor [Alphaproteobacteria bacterium]
MNIDELALCLEKLGHPNRLAIFRLLVRAGRGGLPVGDIQRHLGIPASTLTHHIAQLVSAGLVQQAREGRVLRCTAAYERMDKIMGALTAECCSGVPGMKERALIDD